ncbi:MAG: redox-regulated ATPase YchF [Candidatus Marinimicrobia bacterium]|nr:redox-regulated ATPase YchF [Candidatus Neomarinimicrobiota bacterium]
MSLSVGIIGLPNVGKSTIFNALTEAKVASENYPFCTIDPNHGIVQVPDNRIEQINSYIETEKIIYNSIEFVDIAGLVKGASTGEGLGNKFLSQIRNVDAIIHVVRCFESKDITHVDGNVNPVRDIETINTELILKDMESIDKRINNVTKIAKSGDKNAKAELDLLNKINDHLNEGDLIINLQLTEEEKVILKSFALLTSKPMIFVANISDNDLINENSDHTKALLEYASSKNKTVVELSGSIEMEIAVIDKKDQLEFLKEYGLEESGLNKMIRNSYKILNLETFFTAGPKEIRAWSIPKGATAPNAAGVIHTDFERGFIKAEVYNIKDLIEFQNEENIKSAGKLRQEGKDYIVNDGDIIFFKFNV